jgi:hypothetical protein
MTWRVTHMDMHRRRHQLEAACPTNTAAAALALALWGPALYLAVMRVRGAR